MEQSRSEFWSQAEGELLTKLEVSSAGLSAVDAKIRLEKYGANQLKASKHSNALALFISQFKSPIILILFFAIGLSFFLHDTADALIILTIVIISGALGYWQENGAANAVAKLLAMVETKATVLRDGVEKDISLEDVVPGDILLLTAGDSVAGDCRILESQDLFVNEAALTGETFPVEKKSGTLPSDTPLSSRTNSLWLGTNVVSGSAKALVVGTGKTTEFGKISERLKLRPEETDFEQGIRKFGYLLMEVTLILVIAIFAINVYLKKPALDSFLFSLALAVGLTPQLLPAIISINLAKGAKRMAENKVIVKRLAAIENFGSMNVLCSDKTGTITDGTVRLHSTLDAESQESEKVLLYAYLNAFFESGFVNPIDVAIRTYRQQDIKDYQKLNEIPYDFIRKRLSILVRKDAQKIMITKGALENVLAVCSTVETSQGIEDIAGLLPKLQKDFQDFSAKGWRTLGVAYKNLSTEAVSKENETDMTFLGFITLFDPPKADSYETIKKLQDLGVKLKIITGDNRFVAESVSKEVGFPNPKILAGPELNSMSNDALRRKVREIDVFAEVEPHQKERIITALRKSGNVVGYMGDGINDASALHAADVGISVDSAVDVAKEAADIVLLEKDLGVLVQGVREGRITFANTLKYVFMATSANFGNMFSMAGASLFLAFLPLLPKQILLTNLLTDLPEMAIATDNVDDEMIARPRRWDIAFIRKFMMTFGMVSSVFDYLTFGLLIYLKVSVEQFRTGWFLESVVSAALIVLVVRSRKSFLNSKPGKYLLWSTLIIIIGTLAVPFSPLAELFGFTPLPMPIILMMAAIVVAYILTAELAKKIFYQNIKV